jgi:colanic acid biosynthesis glycosyl transferase WcaI
VTTGGNRLNIAFVSASFSPEPTGIGPYSGELADSLAARGHNVRVVACFPFYPQWRLQAPRGTFLYRTNQHDGVRITRCRVYVPANPRPWKRLIHEVTWMIAAGARLPRLAVWADVWLIVTPSFGSAVLGAILRRVLGARVHLHVQDVVPDVAVESGQLRSGWAARLAERIARWTYRSFRSVSVLSEAMASRIRRYTSGTAQAAAIAPNWVRQVEAKHRPLPEVLVGCPYAVYSGSFGRKQDLDLLVEAGRILSNRGGPLIAVLGDGPGRSALRPSNDGLVWLGLVDDGTYWTILHQALAGIVALAPGVSDSVVPSKLAAYLGAGRPVVVAADAESEATRVVVAGSCGVCIRPGQADLLADALFQLVADRARWQEFSAAGTAYARTHWDKAVIVGRIESALHALCAS